MNIKHYGIAFIFLLVFIFVTTINQSYAISPEDAQIKNYVNDYYGILTDFEETDIATISAKLHFEGLADYAVVIINSTDGIPIEEYSLQLAHENLGNEEKDNGLLLLIAIEDRQFRIETGYGLEGILNDAKTGRFARETLIPYFQQERYGEGITEFSKLIGAELGLDSLENNTTIENNVNNISDFLMPNKIIIVIVIIWFILRIFAAIKYKKSIKKGDDNNSFLAAMILSSMMNGKNKGGGGFGGFGGTGGFSGGGFSRGGGFGGGGFSGRW